MHPPARVIGLLCGALALTGMFWVGRNSPLATPSQERLKADENQAWKAKTVMVQVIADDLKDRELRKQQQAAIEQREWHRPPIADKPPFPKLVVDRDDCDLGIFDAEQTVRNTFKITNIGPARLIIVWHPTSCTHSAGPAFPHYQEIEPGKSLDIEITSTPLEAAPSFKKILSFWTNDPTRPDLDLSISGTVVDAKR
jgi:HYDIN/CFA65/VesB family protein